MVNPIVRVYIPIIRIIIIEGGTIFPKKNDFYPWQIFTVTPFRFTKCQAFDSAVLYVDQKVASSPSSIVGDTVSETRSGPRESTVSEVGESQVVPWDVNAVGGVFFVKKNWPGD